MLCSRCNKNEATFHFEGHINNKSFKHDLCESCAKESGFLFSDMGKKLAGPFPFGPTIQFPSVPPLIHQLFSVLSQLPKTSLTEIAGTPCPKCRWTWEKFQATGLMGCPDCYKHFRSQAKNILKKIHGTITYTGAKAPAMEIPKESKSQLQKRLEKAVKEERYEDAAKLRDQIRKLEKGKNG